jgi:hypothetical protein
MRTTATPRKRKPSTTEIQIDKNVSLFNEVIHKIRSFGCQKLVSSNPDPDERGKKSTNVVADFVKDVELATHLALRGTGLFDVWYSITNKHEWPESGLSQLIIRLCAPVYRERGLQPDLYFKRPAPKSVQSTRVKSSVCGGTVVSIAPQPTAVAHSTSNTWSMPEGFGKTA